MSKIAADRKSEPMQKKYLPTKAPDFIEDQEERRRVIEELAGSMPELPPAEEFLKWRRQSS